MGLISEQFCIPFDCSGNSLYAQIDYSPNFVLRPLFFLFDIHAVSQSPPANFANSLFLITDFCSKLCNFVCGFSHLKP